MCDFVPSPLCVSTCATPWRRGNLVPEVSVARNRLAPKIAQCMAQRWVAVPSMMLMRPVGVLFSGGIPRAWIGGQRGLRLAYVSRI
jgi:hypothetical protein